MIGFSNVMCCYIVLKVLSKFTIYTYFFFLKIYYFLVNFYILFNSPLFTKVRTINFSNYDNDVCGYNPELYVLKNVANSTKVISNYLVNNDKTCNADETMNGSDINIDETSTTLNDFNIDSDDESLKSVELSENGDEEKSEDRSKNIDDDDLFGPSFFQSSIHWVCTCYLKKKCIIFYYL